MSVLALSVLAVSYLALLKIKTEQANSAIDESMVGYFSALNQEDYGRMREFLYPTDNEEYLLTTLLKSKAVGVTSVRLQKIYPALVNGDIAIVGFEVSTNASYRGEDLTARTTDTFFYRRKDGIWYIAKPEDLADIPAQRISDMIDEYQPVMKENMKENISDAQEYNDASFKKLKSKEGR